MPSIVFERCQQIVDLCKQHQYQHQIPIAELKRIIAEHVAGDPRTLKLYISRLIDFGFMKKLNTWVMEILPTKAEKPMVKSQQKTLPEIILKEYGVKG